MWRSRLFTLFVNSTQYNYGIIISSSVHEIIRIIKESCNAIIKQFLTQATWEHVIISNNCTTLSTKAIRIMVKEEEK